MKKAKILIGLVAILLFVSNYAFGQTKCLFFAASSTLGAGDQTISDTLTAWGYEVTPMAAADAGSLTPEEYAAFDFMFASESMDSGLLSVIKTIPIPLANSEGWMVKPGAMDWQTVRNVNNAVPQPLQIVDSAGHPLAAGFNKGDLVTIVTDQVNGLIVSSVPSIDIIPIATLGTDSTQMVIYGIEAGTQNALDQTIQNRVATVGIHEFGYASMTDDAWKFYKAAIDWVLAEPTAVAEEQLMPAQFELAQNFPNPFNPETTINFDIPERSNVKLSIYNINGQEIAVLVNDFINAGTYSESFNGSNLTSGVYFYRLESNGHSTTKRMLLLK